MTQYRGHLARASLRLVTLGIFVAATTAAAHPSHVLPGPLPPDSEAPLAPEPLVRAVIPDPLPPDGSAPLAPEPPGERVVVAQARTVHAPTAVEPTVAATPTEHPVAGTPARRCVPHDAGLEAFESHLDERWLVDETLARVWAAATLGAGCFDER